MTDNLLRTNYALLLFYVREKYWRHAEEVCVSTTQATDDHLFRVWRALAMDQQGMPNEALREYKAVESRRYTAVPALMGMLLIYKRNRDQEGVRQAETKLDGFDVSAHMGGWLQAAAMCWAAGDINAARDHLLRFTDAESAMAYRDEYTNYGTIRAWVDLLSGRAALLEKAGATFLKMLRMEEEEHAFFQPSVAGAAPDREGESKGPSGSPGTALTWTDMNAALGYVTYLERTTQLPKAQAMLDRLVVQYPNCAIPALVGKARLLMHAEDWDQALEVTRRLLAGDKENIEALTLEALYALVRDTRYDAATLRLRKLLEAVTAKEPRNVALLQQFALVFSRLAGDRLELLNLTTKFSDMASNLDARNGDVLCGLGYQQLYRHDDNAAVATFRKASTMTDSLAPLMGTVAVLLRQGNLEEATKQLAFCNELQPANQRNAELAVLNAQLRWRRAGVQEETAVLRLLDQAAEAVRHEVTTCAGSGMEMYVSLNAPLSLTVAREFLLHCRSEPPDPMFKQADVVGERCARFLEFVVQHLPACMEAQLMLAKVWFINGDVRRAQQLIRSTLLVQEQPLAEAFLLSSQICQYMGDVKLASRALQQALTLDFSMQEQPLYNVLLGTVQGTMGKSADSLESLTRAVSAAQKFSGTLSTSVSAASAATTATTGPATTTTAATTTSSGKPIQPLSVPEQVTLALQLAQAHLRLRDVDAARTTLSDAAKQFRDSTQAGRVTIAQAMLAARTDVDKSIELLRQVPSSSSYYIAAHSQLGKLFLTQKHNIAMYIQCFQEMAEAVPTAQSYVELGEAYNTIQEPEQAIAAYEKAKVLAPSSHELSIRVGRALIAAHDYTRAIRYYQEALIADPHLPTVRADLATLLWRLGRVVEARDVIAQSPVYDTTDTDGRTADGEETVGKAIERVNLYLLLYKILRDEPWTLPGTAKAPKNSKASAENKEGGGEEGSGDIALSALLTARQLQQRLVEQQLRTESTDVIAEQRVVMANICTEVGIRLEHARPAAISELQNTNQPPNTTSAATASREAALAARETEARAYLAEAIRYDESNERAQLESAQLCQRAMDGEGCERHCRTVLRMAAGTPSAETAATLLGNLFTQQGRHSDALELFDGLLQANPRHYEALVDFTVLHYRAGTLEQARPALEKAIAATPHGQRADPGLSYARGVWALYRADKPEALHHFNHARLPADNPWCERALVRMVWIYLVPTTQDLWVRGSQNSVASAAAAALAAAPKPPGNWQNQNLTSPNGMTPPVIADARSTLTSPPTGGSGGGGELHDNIRYAEQLLLLLPVRSAQRHVLQAFCTMATQRPNELETAMRLFFECIVAAETGARPNDKKSTEALTRGGGPAASGAGAGAASGKSHRAPAAEEEDDEDAQLLAAMHNAAVDLEQRTAAGDIGGAAGGSSGRVRATLAFALQCRVMDRGAFLGLAIALAVSKQETAARNVLERMLTDAKVPLQPSPSATGGVSTAAANGSKKPTSPPPPPATPSAAPQVSDVTPPAALLTCAEDESLERALLLHAYLDVQVGDLDMAAFMLRQLLAANKGCGAAWDALGMLHERQHQHKEASQCYQKAWVLLRESDAAVGYKLGFNYLRGEEPVKAIDVCKQVLAHHVGYPRIEEDVMDVAYTMLRP